MSTWHRPDGTAGEITLIRTNLAAAREADEDCPLGRSLEARPLVTADPEAPELTLPLADFALGPLMAALDRIEFSRFGLSQTEVLSLMWQTRGTFRNHRRAPAHPGLLKWTELAISHYLTARQADQAARLAAGEPTTRAVDVKWVIQRQLSQPDARGARAYEQTAWGRRYTSADGEVRELWLLSFGRAKTERPAGETAAAAKVTMFGGSAVGGWKAPHKMTPARRPQIGEPKHSSRARVIDVGCADGSFSVLADWNRRQVDDNFAADAAPVLSRVVGDMQTKPGSSCLDCKAITGCTVLPRTPGLLSLTAGHPSGRRMSMSVSDLRYYEDCPAKYHILRQLKLKSTRPESNAIRRGRAVDAWLNERHADRDRTACRAQSGPDVSMWLADRFSLPPIDADAAARMAAHHGWFCPLDGLRTSEKVLIQPQITCFDHEVNLVFTATPDLVHSRDGGWIWRETKTSASKLFEGKPLLRQYPQLALAVLMLNAGALGGIVAHSRVELELLTPDDVTLEEIDPARPAVVDEARQVIDDLAKPWIRDLTYEPQPGAACASCEALDWCQPGQDHLGALTT
ncbi:PD-(D/E)XK nuclease family protein [Micromonospora sp. NPDC005220]|uniref:PD-(D/E)XK nuclease family protein n=1 Tax=Micromonospora sp. NPDC005220 TaxID=3155589 RepID=UPI0033A791BB